MRSARTFLAAVWLVLLMVTPAAAGPTKTYAPPGKAGTSQYSEVVPTSGGNVQTPATGGGNRTPAEISKLGAGRAGVRKLMRLGPQGAAAARFAEATAPSVVHVYHGLGALPGPRTAPRRSLGGAVDSGSALTGIWRMAVGSDTGGIGVFLPLLLAFGLGGAVAGAALKLRRSRATPPPVA